MISLDEALHRLLHKRAYRESFLAGRNEALDLSPEDLAALSSIDRGQLQKTAERVAADLGTRKHRGSGGLSELFPLTIEAWHQSRERALGAGTGKTLPSRGDGRELMLSFLESEAFDAYRELPFAGLGTPLEEAFYQFAERAQIGDPVVRERERLGAILRALTVTPTADFLLPAAVRRVPRGFFAVASRGDPMLYAAVEGRFISGQLTPFLAELLVSPAAPAAVAERHGVSAPVLEASQKRLRELHLLEAVDDVG